MVKIKPLHVFYFLLAILTVIIILANVDSWPFVDGKSLPKGFTPIPPDVTEIRNLVVKIVPQKKLQYWQYEEWMVNSSTIIRSVGDTTLRKRIDSSSAKGGFFSNCVPIPVCHSVISYIADDNVEYVTSDKEMINFIGKIDNLEEAILIARLKGFFVDTEDTRGGSYSLTSDGFELYLSNGEDCPVTRRSVKVNLAFDGKFTAQEKEVYYQTEDCYIY